ncbi:MAG: DEAD/DEAH box helicase [Patescibacteria group bacterium]|jgi:ATP-dependent RNA helicase RhlE
MTNIPTTPGFSGLGIAPSLLDALDRLHFTEPTPVQRRSIPIAIEGQDLIAIAQTGTGKTMAFGIPMIQRLAQVKGRGLIILPTRELAIQVDEALQTIGHALGLRTAVLIGGAPMGKQKQSLQRKPHAIIATPGRLLDHMEQRTISLNDVTILILDEADRMLDMGFAPQIKKILAEVPKKRQTMLFSATMPKAIVEIAHKYMAVPIHVEIAPSGTAVEKVTQEVFFLNKEAKPQLLEKLLKEHLGSVLVFVRTKHMARKLTRRVSDMGHTAAEIHSNRSLGQRRAALDGFKSGKFRVLIATDIAARGIDVTGIELVVNFDLPSTADDYIHRIGRTARAGRQGMAISFATFDQRGDIRSIERLLRKSLPVRQLPNLPAARHFTDPGEAPRQFFSRRRQGSSQPGGRFQRRRGFSSSRRRY